MQPNQNVQTQLAKMDMIQRFECNHISTYSCTISQFQGLYKFFKKPKILMSKHNSKVLKVYEQCQNVLTLKRKFLQDIYIPTLPAIQNEKQFIGIKEFCTVQYIQIAVSNFFKEANENYTKYKQQMSSKQMIQSQIETNIKKIKNTKDLTSRHEQLQHQLDDLKKQWEKEDPLVYYDINERSKIKNILKEKFKEFTQSQSGLKTIKNPHFVHQLINQLKENLEQISREDKQYDNESQENTNMITRYLRDLTKEMEINIESIRYRSFIFEQKKKLFSQFVDVSDSHGRNLKGSRHSNMVRHYFEQLILTSKDIKDHFKKLILFVDSLLIYFKDVCTILKNESVDAEKKYQNFIDEVFKNKQIRVILQISIQQRINNNLKGIFSIGEIIKNIPTVLQTYKSGLIECYNEASNYHERYITRQLKFKQSIDSFEKMLIEHKGYFGSLEKKEERFNQSNIDNLRKFVRDLYEMMKLIYVQNSKQSRLRVQMPVHDTINRIFAEYNFEQEKSELSESSRLTSEGKDPNVQAKIKEYQKFMDSIQLFDFAAINWTSSYYACSLGPKLLIHGYLQILQEGYDIDNHYRIYYESSFNKKNYFFGKTRLFVPKSDIYEINKQIALLIFPDVLQIKANKGDIYFHALGKRDKIYQELIRLYFPEVPQTQDQVSREIEFEFNQFKGESTQERTAFKLKPYAIDFGESTLKNCDLRVIFRRYFSDDSFTYQGKHYQNFKCYQLELVGGINPSSNQITPHPPYYFMKKGEPIFSETVPDNSIRMSTFQKKIPMIPFISKGGNALCEEKSTYYWGSPDFFVIEIENIMKGFKLTEGMTIRLRLFYRQDRQKNEVKCSTSAQIQFKTQGALTGTVRSQALAETKIVIEKTIGVIQKNEKNRSIYKNKGNNIQQSNQEKEEFNDEIQKLKNENAKLNKRLKIVVAVFLVVYLLTIIWMKVGTFFVSDAGSGGGGSYKQLSAKIKEQQGGFWTFW